MSGLVAAFPSPGTGTIEIGPLSIHMYGITLLVAIVCAIVVTGIRWTRRGGDWDLVLKVAVWGVAAGIVGARAYHDITSWNEVSSPKWKGVFAVWEGGLGVWGGILLGCLVGAYIVHREGARVRDFMDVVAPGLLLAQGIGRWGNWWNQELYGKPTDLPWGLKIDVEHRVTGYENDATFHPTFLYEIVWNLGLAAGLVWLGHHRRIRAPGLFALYVAGYSLGRIGEELLRVDPAHHILGFRLNFFVAILLFVAGLIWFAHSQGWLRRTRRPAAAAVAIGVTAAALWGCGGGHRAPSGHAVAGPDPPARHTAVRGM